MLKTFSSSGQKPNLFSLIFWNWKIQMVPLRTNGSQIKKSNQRVSPSSIFSFKWAIIYKNLLNFFLIFGQKNWSFFYVLRYWASKFFISLSIKWNFIQFAIIIECYYCSHYNSLLWFMFIAVDFSQFISLHLFRSHAIRELMMKQEKLWNKKVMVFCPKKSFL